MGIDWGKVRVLSADAVKPSQLEQTDVFNHIAALARAGGYGETTSREVREIYDQMRRNPSFKGPAIVKAFGPFGKFVEQQLTSVWTLLRTLDDSPG
ncbi:MULTISPECIES: hypothetical protein [unclassified Bradyrhizobium]|uniref:hypothetical protein n=1 Tax=unclassified Bradyrhizobium TaxID=2631580 RepID=UPI0033947194